MFMLTVTAPGLVNGAPKMTGFSPAPVVRVGFAVAVSGKGAETDAEGEGGADDDPDPVDCACACGGAWTCPTCC